LRTFHLSKVDTELLDFVKAELEKNPLPPPPPLLPEYHHLHYAGFTKAAASDHVTDDIDNEAAVCFVNLTCAGILQTSWEVYTIDALALECWPLQEQYMLLASETEGLVVATLFNKTRFEFGMR
jgi:hypothetical protein